MPLINFPEPKPRKVVETKMMKQMKLTRSKLRGIRRGRVEWFASTFPAL
jgi:hypothetical protein